MKKWRLQNGETVALGQAFRKGLSSNSKPSPNAERLREDLEPRSQFVVICNKSSDLTQTTESSKNTPPSSSNQKAIY